MSQDSGLTSRALLLIEIAAADGLDIRLGKDGYICLIGTEAAVLHWKAAIKENREPILFALKAAWLESREWLTWIKTDHSTR